MTKTVDLSFTRYGVEENRTPHFVEPILILHGLFGSMRNWATIAKILACQRPVYVLDLRNHGSSPWADDMRYETQAADVVSFIQKHKIGPCTVMGHSMGGKVAMTLALRHADLVSRLVVVDIAPAPRNTPLGAYIKIMSDVPLSTCPRRKDVENHLAPTITNANIRQFLLQNLVRDDTGFHWRLNLEALGKGMKDIADFPTLSPGTQYAGPTLFIRGARSDYIEDRHKPIIDAIFPNSSLTTIPDAGHWLHAEAQDAFLKTLQDFLNARGQNPTNITEAKP